VIALRGSVLLTSCRAVGAAREDAGPEWPAGHSPK
jgi:hypothetical protein